GGGFGKIRSGSKVAYYTANKNGAQDQQFAELGTNIDCRGSVRGTDLHVECSFESSSIAPQQTPRPAGMLPVVQSRTAKVITLIPMEVETEVAGMDDPTTKK